MGTVGAEKEKPGRSAGRRVWALGEGAGLGRARCQAQLGTHWLVVRTGGRRGRGRGRRRQAGWRLGAGVRAVPQGIPVLRPPLRAAPPRPAPAAPPLPSRGPPLGVSSGAAAASPRDRIRLGARGSAGKATGSTARGTQRRVPANAGGTNQPGAWCPRVVQREDLSKFVWGFRKSTALPPPVLGFR